MRAVFAVVLALSRLPTLALACGIDTDCTIGDRTYRIAMPDGTPKGALIHAHGYRGTAQGVVRNRSLRGAVNGLGLALIAPGRLKRPASKINSRATRTAMLPKSSWKRAGVAPCGRPMAWPVALCSMGAGNSRSSMCFAASPKTCS